MISGIQKFQVSSVFLLALMKPLILVPFSFELSFPNGDMNISITETLLKCLTLLIEFRKWLSKKTRSWLKCKSIILIDIHDYTFFQIAMYNSRTVCLITSERISLVDLFLQTAKITSDCCIHNRLCTSAIPRSFSPRHMINFHFVKHHEKFRSSLDWSILVNQSFHEAKKSGQHMIF